jgi:very-short-patch-repair endonuclease
MKLTNKSIKHLAEAICGRHGTREDGYNWTNFIYRSRSELNYFLNDHCKLNFTINGYSRESSVIEFLQQLNETIPDNSSLPSDKIMEVVIELLNSVEISKPETHKDAIDDINNILKPSFLGIEFKNGKYKFIVLDNQKKITYTFENANTDAGMSGDLFVQQFPAGLPYGVTKPDFRIFSDKGIQKLEFELKNGMGILKQDIYPNFTSKMLKKICGVDESSEDSRKQFSKNLREMNQTDKEEEFLCEYAKTFQMATSDIPILIPQAWIQWHSKNKKNLREIDSKHSDELYRVDFVAFWNNKRYAILIDDISHYGKLNGSIWNADEESYSMRLKEDRKLRKEGWEVFRISNWEIRNKDLLPEILTDLTDFIGFEIPKKICQNLI